MVLESNNAQGAASSLVVRTYSAGQTFEFGQRLGATLQSGDVVALVGDLAAGKTWLSKGIAAGLGVPNHEYVNSPAFDIIHEYVGKLPMYHMDFYRLETLSPSDYSWLQEYIEGDGVCVIEWAEKFIDELSENYLEIEISFIEEEDDTRELHIREVGTGYKNVIERISRQ